MRKNITFFDIFVTGIIFLGIIIIILIKFSFTSNSDTLIIKSPAGDFFYSLKQKKKIEIEGKLGITVIEIDYGKFRFLSSPCKNKTCVNCGFVSMSDFPIICLPNKVFAYILKKNTGEDQIDGVSF